MSLLELDSLLEAQKDWIVQYWFELRKRDLWWYLDAQERLAQGDELSEQEKMLVSVFADYETRLKEVGLI